MNIGLNLRLAQPRSGAGQSNASHSYDMALPANYVDVGGKVATLFDLSAIPSAADFTQTTVALRPAIVAGAMQLNASEYLKDTGMGPLVQSNNFEINIRFQLTTMGNNGFFGASPTSGNGRLEMYIDPVGRLRLRAVSTANASVSASASNSFSMTTGGAKFATAAWYTIRLIFHDNVLDYWANGLPVASNVAFDMSAQDAVYGATILGGRAAAGNGNIPMDGLISSFSLSEYVP